VPEAPLASVAVILLTKLPQPGRVKTRLQPALSPEAAAAVQQAFAVHVARRLGRMGPAELVVCFDPPDAGPAMRDLLGEACDATYLPQSSGDLGERVAAAARVVGRLHRRLLLLGVDSPDVPTAHLAAAARLTTEVAVSLGPTDDGGYWCLGLWNEVDADALLVGIRWSSGHEARQTLERADSLGYATATAPAWDDVDHPDDLARLVARLRVSTDPDDRLLLDHLTGLLPHDGDGVVP
jgi:rSAM/selenodomain-associated transferase 1